MRDAPPPPPPPPGRTTLAEVEELVEPGEIDPDEVHLPGIFVHCVVELSADEVARKHIEKRTTQESMRAKETTNR